MSRLLTLQQIAQLREFRAVVECHTRHRNQLAKAQASERARSAVTRLREARDEVLSEVWQGSTVASQALQQAVQCADQLGVQQQAAQGKVRLAEAEQDDAEARWHESRRLQAQAQRACFKLNHALDAQRAHQRRALERRTARQRDDDCPQPAIGVT